MLLSLNSILLSLSLFTAVLAIPATDEATRTVAERKFKFKLATRDSIVTRSRNPFRRADTSPSCASCSDCCAGYCRVAGQTEHAVYANTGLPAGFMRNSIPAMDQDNLQACIKSCCLSSITFVSTTGTAGTCTHYESDGTSPVYPTTNTPGTTTVANGITCSANFDTVALDRQLRPSPTEARPRSTRSQKFPYITLDLIYHPPFPSITHPVHPSRSSAQMASFFSSKKSSASSSLASGKGKSSPTRGDESRPGTQEIYLTPLDGTVPTKKWTYDEAQLQLIEELKQYTSTILLPESDAYRPWEVRFLADPGTHPRYMRAAKWKLEDAKRRIKGTVEWRREFKPELISPEDVGIEAETGKIILSGFDKDARPIVYMRPGRENTETSPRQIRHLIYNLERAIDLAPPGQEQVCIIVDYKSATSQSTPSLGTGRKVLSILQNHYVERLGRGIVVNMPWWMNAFFTGLMPLMDPITRDKVRFNPDMSELVDAEHLDTEFGGTYNLEYDYPSYWPKLTKFCNLASDGTRINEDGESWIPPLGNGIKAASDGLLPHKDAVTTGHTTEDPDEAALPHGDDNLPSKLRSRANTIKSPAKPSSATVPSAGETGLEDATAKLAVNVDGESHTPEKGTEAGPPVGDLVFDHPPSKEEVKIAEAILDAEKK